MQNNRPPDPDAIARDIFKDRDKTRTLVPDQSRLWEALGKIGIPAGGNRSRKIEIWQQVDAAIAGDGDAFPGPSIKELCAKIENLCGSSERNRWYIFSTLDLSIDAPKFVQAHRLLAVYLTTGIDASKDRFFENLETLQKLLTYKKPKSVEIEELDRLSGCELTVHSVSNDPVGLQSFALRLRSLSIEKRKFKLHDGDGRLLSAGWFSFSDASLDLQLHDGQNQESSITVIPTSDFPYYPSSGMQFRVEQASADTARIGFSMSDSRLPMHFSISLDETTEETIARCTYVDKGATLSAEISADLDTLLPDVSNIGGKQRSESAHGQLSGFLMQAFGKAVINEQVKRSGAADRVRLHSTTYVFDEPHKGAASEQ